MDSFLLHTIISSVDVALFRVQQEQLQILLIKRSHAPYEGFWALPGGFVHAQSDRDLVAAAQRVIGLKTGIDLPYLEQVISVGNASRDPRGFSITILYFALMSPEQVAWHGQNFSQASESCAWISVEEAENQLRLAFDHADLIRQARARLKNKATYSSLAFLLMPENFTLNEIQQIYELLTEQKLDKKSFRRRLLNSGLLQESGLMRASKTKSARLYRLANKELAWFERATVGQRK